MHWTKFFIFSLLFSALLQTPAFAKKQRVDLNYVEHWAELSQANIDLNTLRQSSYDLVIIDYSKDKSNNNRFKKSELKPLRKDGTVILSYLAIGQAENSRFYFKSNWTSGNPSYLAQPKTESNYHIQYWNKSWWKKSLKPYLKDIIQAKFNGVYLDFVDEYQYWSNLGYSEEFCANEMIKLVKKIAKFSRKKSSFKNSFVICVGNGIEIIDNSSNKFRKKYLKKIDSIVIEDLFYNNSGTVLDYKLELLEEYKSQGIKILSIENFISYEGKNTYLDQLEETNLDISGFSPNFLDTNNQKLDYIGMSIPAEFQFFSANSFWNTPIPDNPEIISNSSQMIQTLQSVTNLLQASFEKWSIPIHVINSDNTVKLNVTSDTGPFYYTVDPDNNQIVENVPIPPEAWADSEEDGHMILVDLVKKIAWDFSVATKHSASSWTTSILDKWDLTGLGTRTPFDGDYWWRSGAMGSGIPLLPCLVRPEEIEAGVINHVILCATPVNRKAQYNGGPDQLYFPASRTNGLHYGDQFIPEGSVIQLNPNLNLNTLNINNETKIIAQALQRYGMVVGENAPVFKIFLQNLGPKATSPWNNYKFEGDKIPIDQMRVIHYGPLIERE